MILTCAKIRKEAVLETIQEYFNDNLFEPNRNWPKEEFDRKACERWAAKEIMKKISESDDDPLDVVTEFWAEMNQYSIKDDISKESAYACKLSYQIADEIGSLLV